MIFIFLGGKDSTFRNYLVSDLQYMVIASMIIFFIVCNYTKSILVSFVSFSVLTLSMGNAYFVYCAIFQVPYFPFMNMLVTIIVMGKFIKQLLFSYKHETTNGFGFHRYWY